MLLGENVREQLFAMNKDRGNENAIIEIVYV
jgi:hypothetical protein